MLANGREHGAGKCREAGVHRRHLRGNITVDVRATGHKERQDVSVLYPVTQSFCGDVG
jgi:hypothetical protein